MNHWPQKASCPEEKVDTFAFSRCYRRYQDLLEIPGSEVSENCLASFVADNPRIWLRLSIQFWFVGGNHSRALRRKWQEGMQLGFWGECIMVYRQISVKLWDSRPVLKGLSDLSWDSCSGDLKWVVLHTLCVRVVGSAQYTESIFAWFRRVAHGNLWTVTGIDLLYAWLKHDQEVELWAPRPSRVHHDSCLCHSLCSLTVEKKDEF